MIAEVLNGFEPDGDVLLRAISAHVTDEMLDWIAGADYGARREEQSSWWTEEESPAVEFAGLMCLPGCIPQGLKPESLKWCKWHG
jgi:hypothetical protein